MDDFYKQKIIYSEIVQSPQFYLDSENYFPEATTFIMTGDELEILVACLNSRLYSYCFKKFYSGGGLGEFGFRYKKAFLEKLPIPKFTDDSIKKQLKYLVNKINGQHLEDNILNSLLDEIDTILFNYALINNEEKKVINN